MVAVRVPSYLHIHNNNNTHISSIPTRVPQSAGNPFGDDDHLAGEEEEEEEEEGEEGYEGLGQEGPTARDSSRRGGRDIYSYRIDRGRLDEEDNDEEEEEEDGNTAQNEISGV